MVPQVPPKKPQIAANSIHPSQIAYSFIMIYNLHGCLVTPLIFLLPLHHFTPLIIPSLSFHIENGQLSPPTRKYVVGTYTI